MQSDEDARRIIALGAHPERVVVTGNIKVDAPVADPAGTVDLWRRLLALSPGQRVWIAGSTHAGEEDPVLEAHRAALAEFPELVLVIAPRHPERTAEVLALLARRGWPSVRRSELPFAVTSTSIPVPPIIVLDSVGELATLYAIADVVFVGGSLVPVGGHNLLEAAQRRRPVLVGPHTGTSANLPACSSRPAPPSSFETRPSSPASSDGSSPIRTFARSWATPGTRPLLPATAQSGKRSISSVVISTPGCAHEVRERFVRGWEEGFASGRQRVLAVAGGGYRGLLGHANGSTDGNPEIARSAVPRGLHRKPDRGRNREDPGRRGSRPNPRRLGHRPAVVSRGYGRSTRGVQIVADAASISLDPEESGDEPVPSRASAAGHPRRGRLEPSRWPRESPSRSSG